MASPLKTSTISLGYVAGSTGGSTTGTTNAQGQTTYSYSGGGMVQPSTPQYNVARTSQVVRPQLSQMTTLSAQSPIKTPQQLKDALNKLQTTAGARLENRQLQTLLEVQAKRKVDQANTAIQQIQQQSERNAANLNETAKQLQQEQAGLQEAIQYYMSTGKGDPTQLQNQIDAFNSKVDSFQRNTDAFKMAQTNQAVYANQLITEAQNAVRTVTVPKGPGTVTTLEGKTVRVEGSPLYGLQEEYKLKKDIATASPSLFRELAIEKSIKKSPLDEAISSVVNPINPKANQPILEAIAMPGKIISSPFVAGRQIQLKNKLAYEQSQSTPLPATVAAEKQKYTDIGLMVGAGLGLGMKAPIQGLPFTPTSIKIDATLGFKDVKVGPKETTIGKPFVKDATAIYSGNRQFFGKTEFGPVKIDPKFETTIRNTIVGEPGTLLEVKTTKGPSVVVEGKTVYGLPEKGSFRTDAKMLGEPKEIVLTEKGLSPETRGIMGKAFPQLEKVTLRMNEADYQTLISSLPKDKISEALMSRASFQNVKSLRIPQTIETLEGGVKTTTISVPELGSIVRKSGERIASLTESNIKGTSLSLTEKLPDFRATFETTSRIRQMPNQPNFVGTFESTTKGITADFAQEISVSARGALKGVILEKGGGLGGTSGFGLETQKFGTSSISDLSANATSLLNKSQTVLEQKSIQQIQSNITGVTTGLQVTAQKAVSAAPTQTISIPQIASMGAVVGSKAREQQIQIQEQSTAPKQFDFLNPRQKRQTITFEDENIAPVSKLSFDFGSRVRVGGGVGEREITIPIFENKTGIKERVGIGTQPVQIEIQNEVGKQLEEGLEITKQNQVEMAKQAQKQTESTRVKQIQIQTERQAVKQIEVTKIVPLVISLTKTTPLTTPFPRLPIPFIIPTIKPDEKLTQEEKEKKINLGFDVIIKRNKRLIRIAENVPVGLANLVGVKETSGYGKKGLALARSYKIIPTGKQTKVKDVEFYVPKNKFYKNPKTGFEIQRAKFSLSSPLEKASIQEARIYAKKTNTKKGVRFL